MSTPPDPRHSQPALEPEGAPPPDGAVEVSGFDSDAEQDEASVTTGARSSTLTRRVIPLIALTMVVGMLALLAYALLKPDDDGQKIADGGYVIYENPKNARDFELTTFAGESFRLQVRRDRSSSSTLGVLVSPVQR